MLRKSKQQIQTVFHCFFLCCKKAITTKKNVEGYRINLYYCEAAQEILSQRIREDEADVILFREPYKHLDRGVWATDKTGGATIWLTGRQAFQHTSTQVDGFVKARINGIHFYATPDSARQTLSSRRYSTEL